MKVADPPTFKEALGPKTIPAGFIRNRFALPKPVVWMVPKMLDGIAAGHAAEDIGSGYSRFVQEVGDVIRRNSEFSKAMKEVRPIAWPGAAGNIVRISRLGHRCAEIAGTGRRSDGWEFAPG